MTKCIISQKLLDWIKTRQTTYWLCACLILAAFITRIIYVFYITDYKNYLFSDMNAFWHNSHLIFNGDIFNYDIWKTRPAFYYYYLSFIYQTLAFLKLSHKELEVILLLNITYSTISIFFVYLLSNMILKDRLLSLAPTFMYAFSFPLIYLDCLVLSESFAIPCLIVASYITLKHKDSPTRLIIAGLLIGIATCTRSAFALYFLVFLFYLLRSKPTTSKPMLRRVAFPATFLVIISLFTMQNNYISHGELKSMSSYGGANFFLHVCNYKRLTGTYNGITRGIYPPTHSMRESKKQGVYHSTQPIHNQQHFINEGIKCIKNNPSIFIENFFNLKYLFFGHFFPAGTNAPGYKFFLKPYQYLFFTMTIFLGFLYFLRSNKKIFSLEVLFLMLITGATLITNYFFVVEYRLLFPALYAIHILFFLCLSQLKQYKNKALQFIIFLLALICFFIS